MKFKLYPIKPIICLSFFFLLGLNGIILANITSMNSSTLLPRTNHQMVYDEINNQIILFGGEVSGGSLNDFEATWIFSSENKTWTKLSNIQSPRGRFNHRMVYNSLNGKVFLFGGISTTTYVQVNDTWEFDPETKEWTELHPLNSPSVRCAHGMYFDPVYNEIILYGGVNSPTSVSDEMWIYNYTTNNWYQIFPTNSPGAGYGHSFVYDEDQQIVVLFGGRIGNMYLKNDIVFFNRTSISWEKKYPASKPLARYYVGMVYNSEDENFVMFGGDNDETPTRALGDTWIYNSQSNTWLEIDSSVNPAPRSKHAMVYDKYLNKVILFGGIGENFNVIYDDLWIYDPISMTWSQEFTTESSITIWITITSLISVATISRAFKKINDYQINQGTNF